jgi:uncharacterized membrane protein
VTSPGRKLRPPSTDVGPPPIEDPERPAAPVAPASLIPSDRHGQLLLGLICGGGVLGAVGSFMSWVSGTVVFAGAVNVGGLEGDGKITLAFGVATTVIGGVYLAKRTRRWLILTSIAVGLLASLSLYEIIHVSSRVSDFNRTYKVAHFSVGTGLWVVVFGAALAVTGLVVGWRGRSPHEQVS